MRISLFHIILTTLLLSFSIGDGIAEDFEFKKEKRTLLQEGLSQSRVMSIIEDDRGFMWFATRDGLNRYDGYTFKIFKSNYSDSTSLPSSTIGNLSKDRSGNIWIATDNGIAIMDPISEAFRTVRETDSTLIQMGANNISNCTFDTNGDIWYGTYGCGLVHLDPKTFERQYVDLNSNEKYCRERLEIINIMTDSQNRIWLYSTGNKTVRAYEISSGTINVFQLEGYSKSTDEDLKISTYFEDSNQTVWLSEHYKPIKQNNYSEEGGTFYLKKGDSVFRNVELDFQEHYQTMYHHWLMILKGFTEDSEGNIWGGCLHGGIFKIDTTITPTVYFRIDYKTDPGVNCLYYSKNGILWVGTNGRGIEYFIPNKTSFKALNLDIPEGQNSSARTIIEDEADYWVSGYFGLKKISKDFSKITTITKSNFYTLALCKNNPNYLWVGSEGRGVQLMNKKTGAITRIMKNPDLKPFEDSFNAIYKIIEVSDSVVLIGGSFGLIVYNPITDVGKSFTNRANGERSEVNVRTIYKNSNGAFMVGYLSGNIGRIDLEKFEIEPFRCTQESPIIEIQSTINCIYNDSTNYWFATANGLFQYNISSQKSRFFTEKDGLPNNFIYAILPDEQGNLWMSTNYGISCFCIEKETFCNYDRNDELLDNEFNTGAYYKAKNGLLFFGGIQGINYFDPDKISHNSIKPKIEITELKIGNREVNLTTEILNKRIITIPANEEIFTLKFAGLSYMSSEQNHYRYRIIESSEEWIDLNHQHQITFNNMSPGDYTLEILASNNHDIWIEKPYTLEIRISPNFTESKLFIILLIAAFIIFGISVFIIRTRYITHKQKALQDFADKQTQSLKKANHRLRITAEDLEASNSSKDKFLSILAHDIINPIAAIEGLSVIISNPGMFELTRQEELDHIKLITSTSRSLTEVINNVLQWSRLERETITPKKTEINLYRAVVNCFKLTGSSAEEKNILLVNDISEKVTVFADQNMLSTILRNLLSNAIKFTPNGGRVMISAKKDENRVEIAVTDTGIGIKSDDLPKLFEANGHFTTEGTNSENGTGIGLRLVKEFVQLNSGKIWAKSTPPEGSTFYFTLEEFSKTEANKTTV